MRLFTIEVDEEVFRHLQDQARPLIDTPNTVLRRLLLRADSGPKAKRADGQAVSPCLETPKEFPNMPFGTPAGLQQILWVIYLVRRKGRPRPEATTDVAKALHIAPQTVLDKYCRQLGLTAMKFDLLVRDPELNELRSLLLRKFPAYEEIIRRFLSGLRADA